MKDAYKVKRQGSKWVVVRVDNGVRVATYESPAEAAQAAARLNAARVR